MSTKTITLAEDAYEQLRLLKQDRESFTDVVRRIAAKKPLSSFAGLLSKSEAAGIRKVVFAGRLLSRKRADRLSKVFT